MGVQTFTELKIWQRSRQWSKAIFAHTQTDHFKSDRRLVEQINDSSASVMTNIAEGFGRGTQNEFVMFLGYALGSLNETQSHLTAAYDRGYIPKDEFGALFAEGTEIRKMTVAFITSMVLPGGGAKTARKPPTMSDYAWELYERVTGKSRPEFFAKHSPTTRPRAEATA
jgi:four helix bundle protein